jgi:putative flavoprotein involved in K+ transport
MFRNHSHLESETSMQPAAPNTPPATPVTSGLSLTSSRSTPADPIPHPTDRSALDVAIVGAGQAGLAVAWHLKQRGQRFLLLDGVREVGQTWRARWDSLRLFTPAEYCALPGMPFPAPPGSYPTKDEVADYLGRYAATFGLPIMSGTRVLRVSRDGDAFRLQTSQGTLRARQVVVATGAFQRPQIPRIAQQFAPDVVQLHSSEYRSPGDLPTGRVLVVGAGNSGLQIAAELAATHDVHVAAGSRQPMVPQRLLGRDLFWWLTRTGVITRPVTSPLVALMRRRGGDLVIGTSKRSLARAGVRMHGRVIDARGCVALLADGVQLEPYTVVWATGFASDYSWIDIPGIWDGTTLTHRRGVTDVPGLFFIGLAWQHTRGSALLGFVKDDAAWIADQLHVRQAAGT